MTASASAWRSGQASVVEDVDGQAKRREIDARDGIGGRLDGIIFRSVSADLVTIRIGLQMDATDTP